MRFELIDYFYGDSVNFVLELFGPVELVSILLKEQYLCLENADIIDCFSEVIWQVDHLMIEIFIILMPLYHADILIRTYA